MAEVGGAGCGVRRGRVVSGRDREADLESCFVFKASVTSGPQDHQCPTKASLGSDFL